MSGLDVHPSELCFRTRVLRSRPCLLIAGKCLLRADVTPLIADASGVSANVWGDVFDAWVVSRDMTPVALLPWVLRADASRLAAHPSSVVVLLRPLVARVSALTHHTTPVVPNAQARLADVSPLRGPLLRLVLPLRIHIVLNRPHQPRLSAFCYDYLCIKHRKCHIIKNK